MDKNEIENLNPDQILDLYEDILETPERISYNCYSYTSYEYMQTTHSYYGQTYSIVVCKD